MVAQCTKCIFSPESPYFVSTLHSIRVVISQVPSHRFTLTPSTMNPKECAFVTPLGLPSPSRLRRRATMAHVRLLLPLALLLCGSFSGSTAQPVVCYLSSSLSIAKYSKPSCALSRVCPAPAP